MNKRNQKLYLPEQNSLKHRLENKTKARCQVGNKAENKTNKYVKRKRKKE